MLTAHHLTKFYGPLPVLKDISFSLSAGDRLGLIGPNGCGKSTLMRLLVGLEPPDAGNLQQTRPGLRIGYLAQGFEPAPGQTISSTLRPGFDKLNPTAQDNALSLSPTNETDIEAELTSLALEISRNPRHPTAQARYDSLLTQLSTAEPRPEAILAPLGLASLPLETPVSHLSGGQKTRLALAKILLAEPHLLLLDEPTNHLDISMLEWLETWLNGFHGAALIVSHDRAFLDHTVHSILELDPATHGLKAYSGNYTEYVEQKLKEHERQLQTYSDQQAEIYRLKQDIVRAKQQSLRVELSTTPRQPGVRRIAKKVAKKALAREKKLERFLESDDLVEKPRASWQIKLDFNAPEHQSKSVLVTEALSVGYTPEKPILTGLNLQLSAGQRVALIGANGSGKTTLIRTLTGQIPPLAGTLRVGEKVQVGYMAQEQELLNPAWSGLETIQKVAPFNETEARHFLHFFLFSGDDPLRPCGSYSYGERARLMLARLVAQGSTFLVLDEPINHLDIPARARFEQALANFKGAVLAVVHDRYFIQSFAEEIWSVENGGIHKW